MLRKKIYRLLLMGGIAFAGLPQKIWAHSGGPAFLPVSDTLPARQEKQEEPIKEVPKSRKQVKPLAIGTQINTAIKPPVLVQPKVIVKPVIKLH